MKNRFLIILIVFTVLLSCKKEPVEAIAPPTFEEEIVINNAEIFCYQGILKSDTITLKVQIQENRDVTGDLAYLFFEKDSNKGTIVGKMFGDTLRANYIFSSEGQESEREIVFLRKGKIMIEAYGDVEEVEKKMVFKDPKKLFFDSSVVLTEIDCLDSN